VDYLNKHPDDCVPFGFPPLVQEEFTLILIDSFPGTMLFFLFVMTTKTPQQSSIFNTTMQVDHCPAPNRRSRIWVGIIFDGRCPSYRSSSLHRFAV